jgi:hypothetical protein
MTPADPTPAPEGLLPTPLPIDLAPRDGTMLRLRVRYDPSNSEEPWTPLEDAEESWTIGFNNFDNTEEDRWQFVGWSWSHDHLLEAPGGTVIGWLPFHGEQASVHKPVAKAEWLNAHMTCATFPKKEVPVGSALYATALVSADQAPPPADDVAKAVQEALDTPNAILSDGTFAGGIIRAADLRLILADRAALRSVVAEYRAGEQQMRAQMDRLQDAIADLETESAALQETIRADGEVLAAISAHETSEHDNRNLNDLIANECVRAARARLAARTEAAPPSAEGGK